MSLTRPGSCWEGLACVREWDGEEVGVVLVVYGMLGYG